jgi:hypothetical protein
MVTKIVPFQAHQVKENNTTKEAHAGPLLFFVMALGRFTAWHFVKPQQG